MYPRHPSSPTSRASISGRTLTAPLVALSFPLWLALAACGDDDGTPTPDAGTDVPLEDGTGDTDTSAPDGSDLPDVVDEDTGTDTDGGTDADADVEPDVIPSGNLSCEGAVEGTLVPGTGLTLELAVEGGAAPLSLQFLGREVDASSALTLACGGADLVPDGFVPLGPTFSLRSDNTVWFSRRFFASLPYDTTAMPAGARPSSIALFMRPAAGQEARQVIVSNFQENSRRGIIRFEGNRTGEYQLGVRADAGQNYDRNWKFRAITGVSMGASGASMLGVRNLERFDIIAPLGGPTDWAYLAEYIRAGGMGGFNPAPTFGRGPDFDPREEFEHSQAYDEWYFPAGEGTGGSFNRSDYAKIFLDLMLTFGNIVQYRPDSPYAPPGLPLEQLLAGDAARCNFDGATCTSNEGVFTIPTGFYDDEFNPDGTLPVITFCDGRGSRDRVTPFARACDINFDGRPDESNEGLYDDPCVQDRPMDITYAVDVNGNGMRDPGEPIIRNFSEPYDDFGADGIPSELEEGYDPILNPDPAGDDYDYATNPTGTEGNWMWEPGEPFRDFGLDGVEGTPQIADGGYDFGEGNGTFDYNPNLEHLLYTMNPAQLLRNSDPDVLDDVTFYLDAGIRDLFNFAVSTNHFAGAAASLGANFRVYDDFYTVADLLPEEQNQYDFTEVDYENLGDHVYVRYGDLDANEEDICFGDGKHVGTVVQIANRLLTMLGFVTNRFPDGERTPVTAPYPLSGGTFFTDSPSTGGRIRYSIAFPPGYEYTQCTDGIDNDADGTVDGFDAECTSASVRSESGESVTPCTDGIDNDADGRIDAADADCVSGDGNSEWPMGFALRDATYPVVFILHGYGQTPDELQVTALPFSGFMAQGIWPKVILVFPDGYCGENEVTQCNDRIDNDGDGLIDRADDGCAASGGTNENGTRTPFCADGIDNDRDGMIDQADGGCLTPDWNTEADCLRGNFYVDHVAYPDGQPGGPLYEQRFLDLMDFIDVTYPARAPETLPHRR